jgi:glycosyltransferase involved in cell wall biosynthesis
MLIREKIEFLLDNPMARKNMGNYGIQLIRSEYTIERMVKDYLELYESALQRVKQQVTLLSDD